LVLESEESASDREVDAPTSRSEPDPAPKHGDDTMQLLLLRLFPSGSLSIAGFVLSALCLGSRPIDACAAQHISTPPPVALAPAAAADAVVFDCNQNGIEDSIDIALGSSSDQNHDGVPDECEAAGRWISAP